jgi:hypothetical protein
MTDTQGSWDVIEGVSSCFFKTSARTALHFSTPNDTMQFWSLRVMPPDVLLAPERSFYYDLAGLTVVL